MRFGNERGPLIASPLIAKTGEDVSAVCLTYRGESIMQIRGVVTGRIYQFSPLYPVQSVDRRDASFITQSRLLRQVPRQ